MRAVGGELARWALTRVTLASYRLQVLSASKLHLNTHLSCTGAFRLRSNTQSAIAWLDVLIAIKKQLAAGDETERRRAAPD